MFHNPCPSSGWFIRINLTCKHSWGVLVREVSTSQEYLQVRLHTPCQSFFPIRQPVQVGGLDDHKGRQRRLRLCQARKQHSLGLCIRILAVGLKLTNSCRLKYILYSAVFFNRYWPIAAKLIYRLLCLSINPYVQGVHYITGLPGSLLSEECLMVLLI